MRRRSVCEALMIACVGFVSTACASSRIAYRPACVSTLRPDTRSLDEVADSAALTRAIMASWTSVSSRVVGSIAYDSLGSLDTAQVWSTSLPDAARSRVEATLLSHAHAAGAPGQRAYLFLGDEKGPSLRRVPDLEGCPPRLLHPERLARRLGEEGRALGITHRTRVDVLAFVHPDGRVKEVRIKATSGNPDADEAARRIIRDATFLPGMIEGVPISVWASFPITFSVGR